jgi:hypothetical protein
MQCRQARLRLAAYNGDKSKIEADRELLEHLHGCRDCAQDLLADTTLRQLFSRAGIDDKTRILSLANQRAQVEGRAHEEPGRGRKFRPDILWQKPVIGFGLIMAVVVLAFLALVPFHYHRTVGYTITMEGVDEKLAGDIERICAMLTEMGLEDTEVDILGCDTTCSGYDRYSCDTTCRLYFVELKTREEAQRVVEAFAQADPDELTSNITPVRARTKGTLLDKANETLFQR